MHKGAVAGTSAVLLILVFLLSLKIRDDRALRYKMHFDTCHFKLINYIETLQSIQTLLRGIYRSFRAKLCPSSAVETELQFIPLL